MPGAGCWSHWGFCSLSWGHSGSTHYFSFLNIHYYARILSFAIFLIFNRDACSDLVKQNRPCLVLGDVDSQMAVCFIHKYKQRLNSVTASYCLTLCRLGIFIFYSGYFISTFQTVFLHKLKLHFKLLSGVLTIL